jgi:DUF971 family protein
MAYTITTAFADDNFVIKIQKTDGTNTAYETINKLQIRDVSIAGNYVCISMDDGIHNPIYKFDYRNVTAPASASAVAL